MSGLFQISVPPQYHNTLSEMETAYLAISRDYLQIYILTAYSVLAIPPAACLYQTV